MEGFEIILQDFFCVDCLIKKYTKIATVFRLMFKFINGKNEFASNATIQ